MCTNCGQQFEVYNNDKIKPKEIYPPEPFTSEKPNTRVILDIGIDTIPSEFTAEVLLRLIGNYCNEFDRFIIGEVKNGVIKFRFDDRKF